MVWGFMMEYCVGKNEQGKDRNKLKKRKLNK